MKVNRHYEKIKDSYLFSDIAKRVSAYQTAHPEAKVIRMGIGDVTLPLAETVVSAMKSAADEMGKAESFRGYGPEQGYGFLRESIAEYYGRKSVTLAPDEIFVSDGAKSDLGNILDLFAIRNTVLVPDPVYPVYVDSNRMAGRKILFMNANRENGFLPLPDESVEADIIYLCSPNNPTGGVYTYDGLKAWVKYARERDALILFDAAYEAFVSDPKLPTSIFQIDGAKECAIEFCSFSKTAGFTGTRCGYTVVPKSLKRGGKSLNAMWLRRQTTKFNGVPYIVQRGAAAVFSREGHREIVKNINYYRENAKLIADCLKSLGIWFVGGENSPYLWLECPNGMKSWDFFDLLLNEQNIVGTPGEGFGRNGEGYFRLTAFGSRENTAEACERLKNMKL